MVEPSRTVEAPDGTSIAVFSRGEGPPVVLVHGTACDHRVFARVAHRLAQRFTVHALDRRGRGASGDGDDYSLQLEAQDVAAVCQAVAREADRPVALVGHSFGAVVALEAALRCDAVGGLVAYEPPIHGDERPPVEAADELASVLETEGPEACVEVFLAEVGYGGETLAQLKKNEAVWQATVATAATLPREARAHLRYELDPYGLARLQVPVLLGVGSRSPAMFRDSVARLKANLPDARVEVVEGASHAVHLEAPEAYVEGITSFLEDPHARS